MLKLNFGHIVSILFCLIDSDFGVCVKPRQHRQNPPENFPLIESSAQIFHCLYILKWVAM